MRYEKSIFFKNAELLCTKLAIIVIDWLYNDEIKRCVIQQFFQMLSGKENLCYERLIELTEFVSLLFKSFYSACYGCTVKYK